MADEQQTRIAAGSGMGQNILPAISDDLMQRIAQLQALYQVNNKPMPFELLLDQSLTAFVEKKDANRT